MKQDTDSVRLNKYLALQLGISRREADMLIDAGMVSINGVLAKLGARISESDSITVADKSISPIKRDIVYIALNKPVGYVSSRRAQGKLPTIYNLIPQKYHHLKPVGRLDANSSGLLLLTNDGDFAYKMTHPKFSKTKIYNVRINKDLEPLHQQMISDFGINLEDGYSRLHLTKLRDDNRKEWQVTMSEGRNRQIRRTFSALGYDVKKLHRIQFGPYSLDSLKKGEITEISPE